MQLFKNASSKPIIEHLEVADTFLIKAKGLLGRKSLHHSQALWIKDCSSIHTFFMHFSIDAIFIDKEMTVQKICTHIPPGTIRWGNWKSQDVIEVSEGASMALSIHVGDQLNVGC